MCMLVLIDSDGTHRNCRSTTSTSSLKHVCDFGVRIGDHEEVHFHPNSDISRADVPDGIKIIYLAFREQDYNGNAS